MTDPSPAPLIWIDATRPAAGWHLWGMTLVERLLREGARRGVRQAVVVVSAESTPEATYLRRDLTRLFDIDVHVVDSTDVDATRSQLIDAGATRFLITDGDVVHDDRVLDYLFTVGPGSAVVGEQVSSVQTIAAHLSHADLQALASDPAVADATDLPGVNTTQLAQLGHYVADLRLTMAPFLLRITDREELRRVDRLLFQRTFKGVIDAIARYGYYHFVRFTTRWLSRTTVSPNLLTVLSILGIWLAIPCFAAGQIGWGITSAWVGVILDSVDGKLARLTVHLSDAMGALEHATAMPGLGLWFVGLGWHLTGGHLLSVSPVSVACWALVSTFLADKILTGAFRKVFGYELFDARPLDAAFHLIAARRNMQLLLLTIGAATDAIATAYQYMAAGMIGSFAFHAVRFGWIAEPKRRAKTPSMTEPVAHQPLRHGGCTWPAGAADTAKSVLPNAGRCLPTSE